MDKEIQTTSVFENGTSPEKPHIKVWEWSNAPAHLRGLATTGGDEEWVALVPNSVEAESFGVLWLSEGRFGINVEAIPWADYVVYISSH